MTSGSFKTNNEALLQRRTSSAPLGTALKIDFWDVGQGDASVIFLDDGQIVIIDLGDANSSLPGWLRDRPKLKVYAIILTHNDSDHAGCLSDVLDACEGRVQNLWMLVDRNPVSPQFKRLFFKAFALHRQGKLNIRNLERVDDVMLPLIVSSCGRLTLQVLHPDFATTTKNLTKSVPLPNDSSAVIAMVIDERIAIIWAGDAPMQVVATLCRDQTPQMIVGPHHGSPTDRNSSAFGGWFSHADAETVFISVGTENPHSHPNRDFIRHHVNGCRRVVCSQLMHCDSPRKRNRLHVLNSHLVLGVAPPVSSKSVTCRGPVQFTFDGRLFQLDKFHGEHLGKLQQGEVKSPLCFPEQAP